MRLQEVQDLEWRNCVSERGAKPIPIYAQEGCRITAGKSAEHLLGNASTRLWIAIPQPAMRSKRLRQQPGALPTTIRESPNHFLAQASSKAPLSMTSRRSRAANSMDFSPETSVHWMLNASTLCRRAHAFDFISTQICVTHRVPRAPLGALNLLAKAMVACNILCLHLSLETCPQMGRSMLFLTPRDAKRISTGTWPDVHWSCISCEAHCIPQILASSRRCSAQPDELTICEGRHPVHRREAPRGSFPESLVLTCRPRTQVVPWLLAIHPAGCGRLMRMPGHDPPIDKQNVPHLHLSRNGLAHTHTH